MERTAGSICSNCGCQLLPETKFCLECGFPLTNSPTDERAYNVLLIDMKSWMKEAQKAINSILSFAIIFLFIALVVLLFSFLLQHNFYVTSFFYLILSLCYLAFYYLAKKIPYKTVFLAFLFYAFHTVYEFSTGIIIQDIMVRKDQSNIFSIIFKYAPFVYIIFRLMLFSAFIRGIYFNVKIEKHPRIARWLWRNRASFE